MVAALLIDGGTISVAMVPAYLVNTTNFIVNQGQESFLELIENLIPWYFLRTVAPDILDFYDNIKD